MKPLVSVFCPTYNHEKYISECLEGFLLQKTDFEVEFIIQDDASTDSNPTIIKEYAKRDNRIVPVVFTENQFSQGKNLNEYFLRNARGKYLAWCEGDDYWTDPYKLQKQVNFLEANPDYSICFHRVYELSKEGKTLSFLNNSDKDQTYTIDDLAKGNLIHTPSVVYRSSALKNLPGWFSESPVGDYVLHMLSARHGKIKYLPDVMAVYRRHETSAWSSMSYVKILNKWITVLVYLLREFRNEKEQLSTLQNQLVERYKEFLNECIKTGNTEMIPAVHKLIFNDEDLFTEKWYNDFFIPLVRVNMNYPTGVKKSFKHFISSIRKRVIG